MDGRRGSGEREGGWCTRPPHTWPLLLAFLATLSLSSFLWAVEKSTNPLLCDPWDVRDVETSTATGVGSTWSADGAGGWLSGGANGGWSRGPPPSPICLFSASMACMISTRSSWGVKDGSAGMGG